MVNTIQLSNKLKTYLLSQIDTMSVNTPMIGFMKPIISRVLDKNFNKVTKALDLIADENGNVDIESILTEMIHNLETTNPFVINTSFAGDIEIGNSSIKFNIPFTSKKISFDITDLDSFKDMLLNN